ncbi:hypothetical protein E2C01_051562 [Portunus trituberculatus]|uniref:Uncharacterized protein n=1 Tax=Portunus trituberculatus TaxID=210409 RepID=A0A5B7GJ85_PORTR|nr:hypothetical protein [Portunus trituberculatus]
MLPTVHTAQIHPSAQQCSASCLTAVESQGVMSPSLSYYLRWFSPSYLHRDSV